MNVMEQLLKQLTSSELLTEETKTEIATALQAHVDEVTKQTKLEVTANLTERWMAERETLVESLDGRLQELLEAEMSELQTELSAFRDLEAEFAARLVEEKQKMAAQLQDELATLAESLDVFVEVQLETELQQLRESIEAEQEKAFGRKLFEAFKEEFKSAYVNEGEIFTKLAEAEQRLQETAEALVRADKKIATFERETKMAQVLKPLTGRNREVMEAILDTVETPLLEEAYKTFIGRVLRESDASASEKEKSVLAEAKQDEKVVSGIKVTGDDTDKQKIQESQAQTLNTLTEAQRAHIRAMAGL